MHEVSVDINNYMLQEFQFDNYCFIIIYYFIQFKSMYVLSQNSLNVFKSKKKSVKMLNFFTIE